MEMKTVRTCDLIGAALDWAVGLAVKHESVEMNLMVGEGAPASVCICAQGVLNKWAPSADWRQGGPLIREHIGSLVNQGERWAVYTRKPVFAGIGETPLIAACRAIVSAHLGDSVDVPAELAGGGV